MFYIPIAFSGVEGPSTSENAETARDENTGAILENTGNASENEGNGSNFVCISSNGLTKIIKPWNTFAFSIGRMKREFRCGTLYFEKTFDLKISYNLQE